MNANSIILNNMQYQNQNTGIYPPGYIPPNPMGNIVGIGNQGYNQQGYNQQGHMGGTYYGGSSPYNPYLAQQQYEVQMTQQQEYLRQQSDVMKNISRAANKSLGKEVSDTRLKMYDPENYFNEYLPQQQQNQYYNQDPDYFDHNALMTMYMQDSGNTQNERYIQSNMVIYEQEKQKIPDDCGLADYHKYAATLMGEIQQNEMNESRRNLSQLYNSQQYRQLIQDKAGTNNYFNSMFNGSGQAMTNNINIDDMSVNTPTNLVSNAMNQRRQEFINSIVNR